MIAQYTQAAMVAENRRLAAPASVDSMPTSAMQEDHVSMGWGAARKLRASLDNLAGILGSSSLAAARGLELRRPLEPAVPTAAALACVREDVPGFGTDRWLSPELEAAKRLVQSGGPRGRELMRERCVSAVPYQERWAITALHQAPRQAVSWVS